jgi:2'-hydroxyisoflavone reductase
MKILIIGGGRFVGRAFATEALAAGHEVTVFNRGMTSDDPDGVRVLRGDRNNHEDLSRLATASPAGWDAVIDTCGYHPATVAASARALAHSAATYLFISSLNAFRDWPLQPVNDFSSRFDCSVEEADGEYGPLKAGCERAVAENFPGRVLVFNAGLIIGPYENFGHQTWWLSRIARGGTVLAPGEPDRTIRMIDARDIATFGLKCVQNELDGSLIVTSPPGYATFSRWLTACARSTSSDARMVWADDGLLQHYRVPVWTGLPLWAPVGGDERAVWEVNTSRATEAGLVCRPIEDTVHDTWAWQRNAPTLTDSGGLISGLGLAPAAEARILEAVRNSRMRASRDGGC